MGNPVTKNEVLDDRPSKQPDERFSQVFISDNAIQLRAQHAESELELLRSDYLNRIAGMVKAIAAVERSHDKATEAVAYLENLNVMSSGELIEEYRRTSAKFRSAFPTTFGLGPLISHKAKGVKNPWEFK